MFRLHQQLRSNRVLCDGQPRHYSSWEYPSLSKSHSSLFLPSEQELYRRQKIHAPPLGGRRGIRLFLHALRLF